MADAGRPRRYLTITEYGAHRDIAPSTVSEALANGRIRKISSGPNRGKIDMVLADEMWEENRLRPAPSKNNEAEDQNRSVLVSAKAKKEAIVAERELIKLKQLKGELIDKAKVLNAAETFWRQNRDMWLNWPKLVATRMAEELGVDSGLFYDLQAKEVRAYLELMATMDMSRVTDTD